MLSPANHEGGFGGLQPAWEDGERIFYRGWHEGVDGRRAVLVVVPAANPPTPGSLKRLAHEFDLKHELADACWAARPLEMLRERGRTMLVLSDPGGEPLHHSLGASMEVQSFLRIAISLSSAIGRGVFDVRLNSMAFYFLPVLPAKWSSVAADRSPSTAGYPIRASSAGSSAAALKTHDRGASRSSRFIA